MAQIRCQFSRQKKLSYCFLESAFFFFFAIKKVNPLSLPYYFRFVFSSNCLFMPQPISRKTGLLGISLLFGKNTFYVKGIKSFFPYNICCKYFFTGWYLSFKCLLYFLVEGVSNLYILGMSHFCPAQSPFLSNSHLFLREFAPAERR